MRPLERVPPGARVQKALGLSEKGTFKSGFPKKCNRLTLRETSPGLKGVLAGQQSKKGKRDALPAL